MRKIQYFIRFSLLALCAAYAFASAPHEEQMAEDPESHPACPRIALPAGLKPSRGLRAIGSKIYCRSGSRRDFFAPSDGLFAIKGDDGKVGSHYGEVTVVGLRFADRVPNASSIPWLLLEAVTSDGPGVFARTALIQRINTKGGLKPVEPRIFPDQIAWVPYAAEYVFYSDQ